MKRMISFALSLLLIIFVMPCMVTKAERPILASCISGEQNGAVIKSDGSFWIWGWNECGLIDNGSMIKSIPVKKIDNVVYASIGTWDSMVIKSDDSLWGWGNNFHGNLGDGTTIDREVPVKIMDNVKFVSRGTAHSAAIKSDNSLWLWGNNEDGQLGDGTTIDKYTPTKIMEDVAYVSLGNTHSLAVKTDGSLWAWGNNSFGQIGDGTRETKVTPVKIMDNVIYMSVGKFHNAVIKSDNSLWLWGNAELGNGVFGANKPVNVMEDVISVSLGFSHSAAIKKDGSLWLWGSNSSGQLGDGTEIDRAVPVKTMDNVAVASVETIVAASITCSRESTKQTDIKDEGILNSAEKTVLDSGISVQHQEVFGKKLAASVKEGGVGTEPRLTFDVFAFDDPYDHTTGLIKRLSVKQREESSLILNFYNIPYGVIPRLKLETYEGSSFMWERGHFSKEIVEFISVKEVAAMQFNNTVSKSYEIKFRLNGNGSARISVSPNIDEEYHEKFIEKGLQAENNLIPWMREIYAGNKPFRSLPSEVKRDILEKEFIYFSELFDSVAIDAEQPDIMVYVDGEEVKFDQPPVMINNRVMVPVRKVAEKMGDTVKWNGEIQSALIIHPDRMVIFENNSSSVRIAQNGDLNRWNNYTLDVPAQIVNGRTLTPVRAIGECLGGKVEWDGEKYAVYIETDKSIKKTITENDITMLNAYYSAKLSKTNFSSYSPDITSFFDSRTNTWGDAFLLWWDDWWLGIKNIASGESNDVYMMKNAFATILAEMPDNGDLKHSVAEEIRRWTNNIGDPTTETINLLEYMNFDKLSNGNMSVGTANALAKIGKGVGDAGLILQVTNVGFETYLTLFSDYAVGLTYIDNIRNALQDAGITDEAIYKALNELENEYLNKAIKALSDASENGTVIFGKAILSYVATPFNIVEFAKEIANTATKVSNEADAVKTFYSLYCFNYAIDQVYNNARNSVFINPEELNTYIRLFNIQKSLKTKIYQSMDQLRNKKDIYTKERIDKVLDELEEVNLITFE